MQDSVHDSAGMSCVRRHSHAGLALSQNPCHGCAVSFGAMLCQGAKSILAGMGVDDDADEIAFDEL